MAKAAKTVASAFTFGATDAMDVWGDKAAAEAKKAQDEAAAQAAALQNSQQDTPTIGSSEVSAARDAERARKLALAGQNSTILTSAGGLAGNTAGAKTLLGS